MNILKPGTVVFTSDGSIYLLITHLGSDDYAATRIDANKTCSPVTINVKNAVNVVVSIWQHP